MVKIKEKLSNYLTSMAIPGVRQIVTTKSCLFKLGWTILILISFRFGIYNVSYAANNYYQFDVITNIKRNALENVTFPAITICHWGSYKRNYYLNNTFVKTENISIKSNKVSLIRNFFNNYSFFYSNNKQNYVKKELETFNIPDDYDCVRFNGFVTNKSIQLYKTNNTLDFFSATINNYYIENVSNSEYLLYG